MRRKTIVLSEEEYEMLSEYKEENYAEGVPFGAVVSDLIEDDN